MFETQHFQVRREKLKFLKVTMKSINKQTLGVVFSYLPLIFFPPESSFQMDFPQDVNIVLVLTLIEAR